MFKKKNKKIKNIDNEALVDETVSETPEALIKEDLELSFDIEEEIALEPTINANINEAEKSEDSISMDEELISFGDNRRKSFIEEEDLKFKEVIEDIDTIDELDSNFINISDDNEIIEESIQEEIQIVPESLELIDDSAGEEITITEEDLIPTDENKEDKKDIEQKDLKKYFDDTKNQNKKFAKKNPKKIKPKKVSKRSLKQKQIYDDIQNQKIYRFRGKKYSKVEDFIKYLNDNYLDIEKISKEVLDDKAFYGFIAKKSGVFDSSIKEFKSIKEEIDD